MADRPPASLAAVEAHLTMVTNDSTMPLNSQLLDQFRFQLTDLNVPPLISWLLPRLLQLLPSLQQDPEPLVDVIRRLIAPMSFTEAASYTTEESLAAALNSPAPSVNLLAVQVLQKAVSNSGDIALLAGMKDLVASIISAYFCNDTRVALELQKVIEAFLERDFSGGYDSEASYSIDKASRGQLSASRGHGLMWRRLFKDKDIYSRFYSMTSTQGAGTESRQRTIAQSRLLDILPSLVKVDFETVSTSQFPEIEARYGVPSSGGLLDYAALHMVDTQDDVLMHMTLINFFIELLKAKPTGPSMRASDIPSNRLLSPSSTVLEYLISRKIHQETLKYYLEPQSAQQDPGLYKHLFGRSAHYLAAYASAYPDHLLTAPKDSNGNSMIDHVLSRISQALEISTTHPLQPGPQHDLHILVSLPRLALLPDFKGLPDLCRETWQRSPVSRLPAPPAHEDYLYTIATLFIGPVSQDTQEIGRTDSALCEHYSLEAAAARVLFFIYLQQNPSLFSTLVDYASDSTRTFDATAAIAIITAVIKAKWAPLPPVQSSSAKHTLPTEDQLKALLQYPSHSQAPSTGVEALLVHPAAEPIIPYLCSRQRAQSHIVRPGYPESDAYKTAVAKFDALKALNDGLKDCPSRFAGIKDLVATAVGRGLWGGSGGAGTDPQTMEL